MENFDDDYWETNMFLQPEELDLDSYLDESIYSYYDSSSPDGTNLASKNIISERNRRKRMNERLYALRSVVPNITKMDKASIIKDAIEYIKTLHEEEKKIQAEILELESGRSDESPICEFDQEISTFCSKAKRTKLDFVPRFVSSPIEILELRVSNMGEKTLVVSLTCSKKRDTMVKLCQIFESLKLKVITANITAFPRSLLKTVFLEVIFILDQVHEVFMRFLPAA